MLILNPLLLLLILIKNTWNQLSNPKAEIDILNLLDGYIPSFDSDKAAAKMTFFLDGYLDEQLKTSRDSLIELKERFASAGK